MFVTFVISNVKDSHIQVIFYALSMQDRPTFGVLSNQGVCHLCSVATTTENFSETKFRKKKNKIFCLWKHTLSYNFHIWKNAYHRVFIQFSVRMELYEIVWQEVSHIWKLYDKKFWSTRVVINLLNRFDSCSLIYCEMGI